MPVTFLQKTTNSSDLATYTFSAVNFGTAAADRYIIAAVYSRSAGNTTLNSVTIGGVPATIVADVRNDNGGATTRSAFAIALVPTGTTGDVVLTYSATQVRAGISLYNATDLSSPTPTDTATSVADAPATNTLDVNAGGFALAVAYNANAVSAPGATWAGLSTEDYDSQIGTETNIASGARETFAAAQTNLTITCTFSTPSGCAGSFASWGLGAAPGGAALLKMLVHHEG